MAWNAWNPRELCRWPNVGLFGIAEAKCTRIDVRTACSTVSNLLRSNCSLAGGVAPIRCGESGGVRHPVGIGIVGQHGGVLEWLVGFGPVISEVKKTQSLRLNLLTNASVPHMIKAWSGLRHYYSL